MESSRLFGMVDAASRLYVRYSHRRLLGLMGRRLFNWRTGLITASSTLHDTEYRWAQNAFYSRSASSSASLPSGASMKLFGYGRFTIDT